MSQRGTSAVMLAGGFLFIRNTQPGSWPGVAGGDYSDMGIGDHLIIYKKKSSLKQIPAEVVTTLPVSSDCVQSTSCAKHFVLGREYVKLQPNTWATKKKNNIFVSNIRPGERPLYIFLLKKI